MKKIISNILMTAVVIQMVIISAPTAFAQYDDLNDGGFDTSSYGDYGGYSGYSDYSDYSGGYSGGSGYSYTGYDPYTPVSYGDLNNDGYSDGSTYYGSGSCIGCSTGTYDSGNGYSYTNYDPYTPVSYGDLNNDGYSDGSTYYGTESCAGCTTGSTYTSPTYSTGAYTGSTYTGSTYTGSTYVGSSYTGGYTTPVTTTNIVCTTGTLVNGQCVNTVTGTVITQIVCPSGTTKVNNQCINTVTGTVITQVTCPAGSTKVNNQCINTVTGTVITQITCPAGSTKVNNQCINTVTGTVVTNVTCPSGTTQQGNQCINNVTGTVVTNVTCPSGTTQQGNQCLNNVTGTVVTNVTCPAGTVQQGNQCLNSVNGTVVTTVNCPAGTILQNGQCLNSINGTVVTSVNCPPGTTLQNGQCVNVVSGPVYNYQTCWDGSRIPTSSVCPSQYKICSNGMSIPINQTCYVTPTPTPVLPPVIKFNNVVTSPATQVTLNSGRCNGIGLIANGAASTGWFEYGETANLGRTTAQAQIGSANTAPFSNVLANLKPSTKYYCRAVMQNQYGTVKGEIVSFVTKSTVTTYVKPIITAPITKAPVSKNEVVCVDGTTVKVSNETSATLLNEGQKLIALQIEKVDGTLASEETVHYKVNFKNLGDTRLTNILLKVTLPAEVTLTNATVGSYDPTTRTITFNIDGIDPYAEGSILITGTIVKDAPLGKTIVTNVYANYTVPGTKTQDEVTAYVVGSIVTPSDLSKVDTGAKKVVGANSTKGFMPNSLIEWLALIAILFIIFILGRSIYASYKDDEASKH